ncbi:MAG TPA: hypothetical protein VN365_03025 [Candidatus Thermoplasmatota archaeon]|jgi:hypothetical protein|nr:hypothetical protein [Candidatus Thermoplasmatota archaeon]
MELNLSEKVGSLLQAVFLLILPWIVLLIGLTVSFENVWFYLLCITWFGCGLVFFGTLN